MTQIPLAFSSNAAKNTRWVVAIDGPAGAGKSTIAKTLARELDYRYIDTGAMYRAVAWKALEKGVPPTNEQAVTRLARKIQIQFFWKDGVNHTVADGVDVTLGIRTQDVTQASSAIAVFGGVRQVLRESQRVMGKRGGVVMEGRDIGTVVFPKADFKFYLDASPLERARRRYRELTAQKKRVSLRAIAEAIRRRDKRDSTRKDSPLRPAPDAVVVDTTKMTPDDVVAFLQNWMLKKKGEKRA